MQSTMTAKNIDFTEAQEGKLIVNNIAMIMTLVSFSMLFATLFMGYIFFRLTTDVWPPLGIADISLTIPTVSTVAIILSSISLLFFEKKFQNISVKNRRVFWVITFALGVLFMISQIKFWGFLKATGILVDSGIFASIIYAMTWIHAAHIVGGLCALMFLLPALKEGVNHAEIYSRVQNVSKFWHFLGLVWLIIYFGMFVF